MSTIKSQHHCTKFPPSFQFPVPSLQLHHPGALPDLPCLDSFCVHLVAVTNTTTFETLVIDSIIVVFVTLSGFVCYGAMEGVQQPGGGMGGMGGMGVKKVKFTVTVNGRKWSSARLESEMLQDFLAIVQNNARCLEYISQDDTIQRLQLANGDGSEPEDLDIDATLGDVMICKGRKHLVAVVKSTTPTDHPNLPPTATTTTSCPVIASGHGQRSSLPAPNAAAILARCSSHYSNVKVEQVGVDSSRHGHVVGTGVAVEDPHLVSYFPLDPHARGHRSGA